MKKTGIKMLFFLAVFVLFGSTRAYAAETKTIDVKVTNPGDAYLEIQEYLNQAKEDSSGNTLYVFNFPKGEYIIKNNVLKVYSYSTLNLEGSTIKRDYDNSDGKKKMRSMLRIGNVTGDVESGGDKDILSQSGYEGYHDIKIVGGTFDGNSDLAYKQGYSCPSMLRFGHGYNLTFEGVTFQNVYECHHMEFAACKGITIRNCVFKDFTVQKGKSAANYSNNEAVQFDIMHMAKHFTNYPGYDDTPCQDIVVEGCTFTNCQRGIGTHSGVAGSYFTNIKFANNTFNDIDGYAIIATNYKNAVISGNTINDCGAGILFRSMVQGHNTFYAPLSGSYTIDNDAASVISGNNIQISDKKYTSATAYGISLYGEVLSKNAKEAPKGDYTLKGVTVSGNTITMNNSGYGLWLQTANTCEITSNSVTMNIKKSVSGKGNSDCIRLVKSKNINITGNSFVNKKNNKKTKKACGIVITTKSSATVENNTIKNSPKDAVFVTKSSSATVKKNKINKTGRYGLNVCDKSTARSIKNKFKKCKKRPYNVYKKSKIKKK